MRERRHILVAIAAGISFALATGCSWPSAAPLRGWREIAADGEARAARLQVAPETLSHPLLPARNVDPSDGIDPDEAALLAVLLSPQLAAARAARGESGAALLAAGLLPNPVFEGEYQHPYGSESAGSASVRKLGLSLDTASLVARAARSAAASAHVQDVDLGVAWQEFQVAESARLQVVRLSGLERRLPLARERAEGEGELARVLAHALARGDVARAAVAEQSTRAQSARQLARDLASARSSARIELDSLLGLSPETELVIAPPTAASEWSAAAGEGLEALFGACFERRLDLAALRAGYQAQEAVLRESILEQLPHVSIGITHERNDSRVSFLGGVVSLGLPIFDRGQAGVALAEATRERLRLEYEARVAAARAELAGALDELRRLGTALDDAAATRPEAEALWHAQQAAAARGDLDRVSEQAARTTWLELELELASLAQARDEVGVALDTACGGGIAAAVRAGGASS